jgi:hypothetical protein
MPRSQANLKLTFLRGLRGRTIEAKLLYVALLLEPSLTSCGVGAYRLAWWAREAELKPDEADRAMAELEEHRYAYADTETGEVLVRTLIRRDGIAEKPNMLWAACRAAQLIQSEKLRRVVAEELRKLPPKPPPTITKAGKVFHHADPHQTAEEIDPSYPQEPIREPISEPIDEPIESNLSGTIPRTTGGGGGGGGKGSTSVGGYVGGSRASAHTPAREEPPPTPHDPPCEKPCRRCKAARLAAEAAPADAAAAARREREAVRAQIDACDDCDEYGFALDDDGTPAVPARRCHQQHRPLRSVS